MSKSDDEVLVSHPARTPVYSSPAIHERRHRILKAARNLLADDGLEGFSIRKLSKRAEVAQRTLYNAFHSKDRIMAIVIRETYEGVNRNLRYHTSPDTLDGIIDRLISINSRNLKSRNYTRVVASLYFSPDIARDIWMAMRAMVDLNLRKWLDRLDRENGLQGWVNVDDLAGDIANIEYAIINDWAQGRLSDDEYLMRLVIAVLSHTVGVTAGPEQEKALSMLTDIGRSKALPQFRKPVYSPDRRQGAVA
jgi:AcrR family transcriptional regulator